MPEFVFDNKDLLFWFIIGGSILAVILVFGQLALTIWQSYRTPKKEENDVQS